MKMLRVAVFSRPDCPQFLIRGYWEDPDGNTSCGLTTDVMMTAIMINARYEWVSVPINEGGVGNIPHRTSQLIGPQFAHRAIDVLVPLDPILPHAADAVLGGDQRDLGEMRMDKDESDNEKECRSLWEQAAWEDFLKEIGPRASNALKKNQIYIPNNDPSLPSYYENTRFPPIDSFDSLLNKMEIDLLRLGHLGKISFSKISKALERRGLKLNSRESSE